MSGILKSIKDLEKTGHWPEISQVLFPRRILPPQGYPSPKHFAWGLHCNLVNLGNQVREKPEEDQTLWECHVWRNAAAGFISHGCPAFFLDKELTEMLENTEPPEDIQPEDLELPYPCFGLILPETKKWPLLLIAEIHDKKEDGIPKKQEEILKGIPTPALGRKHLLDAYFPPMGKNPDTQTTLAVLRGKSTGLWAASWCPMQSKGIGEIVSDYKETLKAYYQPQGIEDPDSGEITAFTLNFLAYLRYEYEKKTEEKPKTNWERAREKPDKKGWIKPILIGERKQSENRTDANGEGKTPSTHWRRGHWHTVLHGPKKSERTKRWYRPTLIANG